MLLFVSLPVYILAMVFFTPLNSCLIIIMYGVLSTIYFIGGGCVKNWESYKYRTGFTPVHSAGVEIPHTATLQPLPPDRGVVDQSKGTH